MNTVDFKYTPWYCKIYQNYWGKVELVLLYVHNFLAYPVTQK